MARTTMIAQLRLPLFFTAFLTVFASQLTSTPQAEATQIDLSLSIFYTDPTDDQSGGNWLVSAKSDSEGISGVSFSLQGISGGPFQWLLPSGEFSNGDDAGFTVQQSFQSPDGFRQFLASQSSNPTDGGLSGAFYQFGVQDNGSPMFPGADPAANQVGPNLPTLTTTTNVPWSVGDDPLGNSLWDSAGLIAAGQFGASQTPSFFESSTIQSSGSVFTTEGTAGVVGDRSLSSETTISMVVRTNLTNLTGDYNADGAVDAADYTVWRATLGASVTAGTGADGSGNGIVDEADFAVWRSNYGASGAGASASSATIPEPSSIALLLGCMLLSVGRQIRHRC